MSKGDSVENIISKLLSHYEHGQFTRRELVEGLAMLAVAGTTASAAGFDGASLDHVSIQVSDVRRSADWYKKAFNLSERKSAEENVSTLILGASHLSIRTGKPVGTVDHIAIGLENFNEAAVIEDFKKRGFSPDGHYVKDPDGLRIQLVNVNRR